MCLLFPCLITEQVGKYLEIWHNSIAHISSVAENFDHTERDTFSHGHVWCRFVYMKTMWTNITIMGLKNMTCNFIWPSALCIVTLVFKCVKLRWQHVNKYEWKLFPNMQHYHPHTTLWRDESFLICGGRMVRRTESLLII